MEHAYNLEAIFITLGISYHLSVCYGLRLC